jgi:hypothetical protein
MRLNEDNYNGDCRSQYPRQRRDVWCKCGNPDLPGSCPGWRDCPMHGEIADAGDEE